MERSCRKNGFKVIADIAAVAEHSIMHQYATGNPGLKDKSVFHECGVL